MSPKQQKTNGRNWEGVERDVDSIGLAERTLRKSAWSESGNNRMAPEEVLKKCLDIFDL